MQLNIIDLKYNEKTIGTCKQIIRFGKHLIVNITKVKNWLQI